MEISKKFGINLSIVSLLLFISCGYAIWIAYNGDLKDAVIIFGLIILLQMPVPLWNKKTVPDHESLIEFAHDKLE